MPSFPQSGIEFIADAEQYLSTVDEMLSATEDMSSSISAQADAIASSFDNIDFEPLPFDEIVPEDVNVEMDIEPTQDSDETVNLLKLIAGAHIFEMILNIVGTAVDFFHSIESITVAPILDVEDAMARFQAQTGASAEELAGFEAIMNRLHFREDVGEGFQDIVGVMIEVRRAGVSGWQDVEEAALGALQVAKSQGADATETFRTMNVLVGQGLVNSWTEAADLMTAGFQTGANRAGDMMQTLIQFGPMFAEMGLDGREALSILSSGLDAGFRSAQDVARAISTMNDNLAQAAGNLDAPINAALESIGVAVPEAGEQVGEDFLLAVLAGLVKHPEQADAAIADIFGTRAGRFSEAITQITTADPAFENLENRAAQAATQIDNSLRGAIDDFILWIQGEINTFLSSAEIDLPGKLNELKERIQNMLTALAEGQGLPVALEMAFEAPGLAAKIEHLEGVLGNFILDFLSGIANILDALNQAEAAATIRGGIAGFAPQQLAFDLKVATDTEDMQAAITRAMQRGISDADLASAMNTALTELAQSGDVSGFTALAHTVEDQFGVDLAEQIQDVTLTALSDALSGGDFNLAQEIVDNADPSVDASAIRDTLESALYDALGAQDFASALNIADMIGQDNIIAAVQQMADEAGQSFGDLATSAEDAGRRVHDEMVGNSVVSDLQAVMVAGLMYLPPLAGLFRMIESVASASLPATEGYINSLTGAIVEGMGNALPVVDDLINKLHQLSSAATDARETVQSLPSPGNGGGGSTTNTNTVTVNQTNNVQSQAEAGALNFRTSRAIRGFAA